MKRVAVLGKGELAVRVADYFRQSEAEFRLVGAVPVRPEPAWSESFTDWCRKHQVAIYDTHDGLPGGLDLVVSVFYHAILKKAFLDRHASVINIHNGPLPRYRGMNPINWALKNNELEHGVTIHIIREGIDDGPILGQVRFSIYPETDEVRDVYRRCLTFGWELFQETIPRLDSIRPREQDAAAASYYSSRDAVRLGERSSWTRSESIPR